MKKNYMQPTILVVRIQHGGIVCVSQASTTGLGGDNLNYDANGGDQSNAWTKESTNAWDEEW